MCNQHSPAMAVVTHLSIRKEQDFWHICAKSLSFFLGKFLNRKTVRKRQDRKMDLVIQVVLLILGFVMLVKGADWFVEGASKIADRFGIPQLVIGLTIVAMGTSAPEAAISITAALKGSADITIGNIIGSNILNIWLILGITSVIIPLTVQRSTIRYEIPFVVVITAVLLGMGAMNGKVTRAEGIVLLALMVLFLLYLLWMSKKGEAVIEEGVESSEKDSLPSMLGLTAIGIVLIVAGSNVTVNAATEIARIFGMSERLIALTIVAFGTSLPELMTSVTAGIKGKSDIAVGNIVGSNIFNILFVVGISALITPVTFIGNFITDSLVAIAAALMLLLFVIRDRRLGRVGGILMLVSYGVYFIWLMQ